MDITAAVADADPWRAATGNSNASAGRAAYFGAVYELSYWSAQGRMPGVPGSGPGSTAKAAANAIIALEGLVRELGIELLVDAPCGDLTWVRAADLGGAEH